MKRVVYMCDVCEVPFECVRWGNGVDGDIFETLEEAKEYVSAKVDGVTFREGRIRECTYRNNEDGTPKCEKSRTMFKLIKNDYGVSKWERRKGVAKDGK